MSLDPNLVIRDLVASDYHKGYLQVLAGLTTVGEISEKQFVEQLAELRQSGELHQMIVIEQLSTGRVVAAGTLFVERKWIHSCGRVGHIEDIVADKALKGHRLGSRIIAELVRRGRAAGCYKIILDCSKENIPFYEKCGFTQKEYEMALYFEQTSKL